MGTSLSSMWRDFEKEKPLGYRSVFVWVDLEMNKIKKLEQEIQELKSLVLQLQSQMLALSLSRPFVITAPPNTLPNVQPGITPTPWPPYTPYIGDPPGWQGTSTVGVVSKAEISGSSNQDSRCC